MGANQEGTDMIDGEPDMIGLEQYERNRADRHERDVAELRDDNERLSQRVYAAIDLAVKYGGVSGDQHRAWVIDQMVRALAGDDDEYRRIVAGACAGDDGPATYSWDVGTPP
jgi:hypothetical protein